MQFQAKQHTFVVCAYKESAFLDECISSLMAQTVKSNILIATSTPCEFIETIAQKYQLPLFVNPVKGGGIACDWNFGYGKAETPLITLAHQDDIYKPEYLENILKMVNEAKKPLIAFTDYGELRGEAAVYKNMLLNIKRMLLFPMRAKICWGSRFVRRRSLSMGCAIAAPTVTYVKPHLPQVLFSDGYRSDLDWQTWECLSKLDGSFVYCTKPLMLHRIHTESETSQVIADNRRIVEDFEMFCKFWPKPIAHLISKVYRLSERSNE